MLIDYKDEILITLAFIVTVWLILTIWKENMRDFTGYKVYKINGDLKKIKRSDGLNASAKEIDLMLSKDLPFEIKIKNRQGVTVKQTTAKTSVLGIDREIDGYLHDWVATVAKERTK